MVMMLVSLLIVAIVFVLIDKNIEGGIPQPFKSMIVIGVILAFGFWLLKTFGVFPQ
jgi:hypothetical protein